MDNVAVTGSCFKRSNQTCKDKKTIIADIHMRCMLVAVLTDLPERVKLSEIEQLKKMTQNHEKLINEKGFYYLVFHIEMKQHFGTQTKEGWNPGNQQWDLYQIQSWPI